MSPEKFRAAALWLLRLFSAARAGPLPRSPPTSHLVSRSRDVRPLGIGHGLDNTHQFKNAYWDAPAKSSKPTLSKAAISTISLSESRRHGPMQVVSRRPAAWTFTLTADDTAAANPCTSRVQVPGFLVQSGIVDHCRVCNLQILHCLRLSWFEPMPGNYPLFSTTYRIFQVISVPVLYGSRILLELKCFNNFRRHRQARHLCLFEWRATAARSAPCSLV
jgi:hypothetical protein